MTDFEHNYKLLSKVYNQDRGYIQARQYLISYNAVSKLFVETREIVLRDMQRLILPLIQAFADLDLFGAYNEVLTSGYTSKYTLYGALFLNNEDFVKFASAEEYVRARFVNIRCCFCFLHLSIKLLEARCEWYKLASTFDACTKHKYNIKQRQPTFCVQGEHLQVGSSITKPAFCTNAPPLLEPYTKSEHDVYKESTLRDSQATMKYAETIEIHEVTPLSGFIAGISGHLFESYVHAYMFIVEPSPYIYALILSAMLITATVYYHHSTREYLIIYLSLIPEDWLPAEVRKCIISLFTPATYNTAEFERCINTSIQHLITVLQGSNGQGLRLKDTHMLKSVLRAEDKHKQIIQEVHTRAMNIRKQLQHLAIPVPSDATCKSGELPVVSRSGQGTRDTVSKLARQLISARDVMDLQYYQVTNQLTAGLYKQVERNISATLEQLANHSARIIQPSHQTTTGSQSTLSQQLLTTYTALKTIQRQSKPLQEVSAEFDRCIAPRLKYIYIQTQQNRKRLKLDEHSTKHLPFVEMSAFSQYVAGVSKLAYELCTLGSLFLFEPSPLIYLQLILACLFHQVSQYSASAREVLIVYVLLTNDVRDSSSELKRCIQGLFTRLDCQQFEAALSKVYECAVRHLSSQYTEKVVTRDLSTIASVLKDDQKYSQSLINDIVKVRKLAIQMKVQVTSQSKQHQQLPLQKQHHRPDGFV